MSAIESPVSSARGARLAGVLTVIGSVLVPLAVVLIWVETTLFDADVMSERAVATLDSEAVRQEIAVQLTDQLARRGNAEAIAFRPAAIVVAEAVIDTEAFRSIFATAIRETHSALLADADRVGLDLSDSLGLVATGLQLDEAIAANPGDRDDGASFESTLQRVADLPIWNLRDVAAEVALAAVIGATLAVGGSVLLAGRRRHTVARLGWGAAIGAAVTLIAVSATSRLTGRVANDAELRRAIADAVWRLTADLRTALLAVALLGLTVAAAVAPGDRFSPRRVGTEVVSRLRRMRATPRGSAALGAGAVLAGIVVLTEPDGVAAIAVHVIGLGLVFAGVRSIVTWMPADPVVADAAPRRRGALIGAVAAVVLVAATIGIVQTMRVRSSAAATLTDSCLGSSELCDRRLDEVTFPGAHNAMSSVEYPGWLFAEQVDPIGGQLRRGVRALLLDTHYGRRSSVVVPGTDAPVVITDVAAQLAVPGAEVGDPTRQDRADELAALAESDVEGEQDVYLCHNHCELGAVRLVDELRTLHQFLDEHPGEIVLLILQDATASADVVAAFDDAGLAQEVVTLSPDAPLPTIGSLVDAGTQLVVFAERGDDTAPPWYHRAYDWFQETTFGFDSVEAFDCEPNRGDPSNPLFLVNHWVSTSPPDPAVAAEANSAENLRRRLDRCADERGLRPTVVAVDFATSGDLVSVTSELNRGAS